MCIFEYSQIWNSGVPMEAAILTNGFFQCLEHKALYPVPELNLNLSSASFPIILLKERKLINGHSTKSQRLPLNLFTLLEI
jgi:hypothetical protein